MRPEKKAPPFNAKHEAFCVEYVKTSSASKAYRTAFESKGNPTTCGKRADALLRLPHVAARIIELRGVAARRAEFEVEDVLRHWVKIATANPNDLIQNRRTCCRHCHGIGHQYQWVEIVYQLKCAEAIEADEALPLAGGGFGFNATFDPVPGCPMCYGQGVEGVYIADTRKLMGSAKYLYGGMKKTKDGVQVLMRDQDDALRNIAKFLGMDKKKVEITGPNGAPITSVSTVTTDPVEAAKIYQKFINEN